MHALAARVRQIDLDHRLHGQGLNDEKDGCMTLVPIRDDRAPAPSAAPPSSAVPAWRHDWAGQGRCSDSDPDALFVQGREQRLAKVVCRNCPVVAECLADALDNRTPFGVWGGMTERERRALLRARPDVTNWTRLIQSMRAAGGSLDAISQRVG